jgi:hypothetical protein
MKSLKLTASILLSLTASVASADTPVSQTQPGRPLVVDPYGSVEHYEYRVETTSTTYSITIKTPLKSVVEQSSSKTFDEDWSRAFYDRFTSTVERGNRSDATHDASTTIRHRHLPFVPPRSPCLRLNAI